ncbi:MAG: hypothetical protein EAZ55_04420 [Cytophagales bacterium]|nr:MAG: hypothetical protein EAZ55_04420 [Cytophagales bacterium]
MRTQEKKMAYFQNLYAMAMADEHFSITEEFLLKEMAHNIGLDYEEAIQHLSKQYDLTVVPSASYDERVEQLEDMILLLMADRRIYKKEMDLCVDFAQKNGFTKEELYEIIKKVFAKSPVYLNGQYYEELFTDLHKENIQEVAIFDTIQQSCASRKIVNLNAFSEKQRIMILRLLWLVIVRLPGFDAQFWEKHLIPFFEHKDWAVLQRCMFQVETKYGRFPLKIRQISYEDIERMVSAKIQSYPKH